MSGIKEIFTGLKGISQNLIQSSTGETVKKNVQMPNNGTDIMALDYLTTQFNKSAEKTTNLSLKTSLLSGEPANFQNSDARKFISDQADKLILRGTVPDRKINPNNLSAVFANSAVKNPKAVAAAMYHSSVPNEFRYFFARDVIEKLSGSQLQQLSKTDEGRTFLRTMCEIVEDEAPDELKNNQVAREKDASLIGRVRDKMYISDEKQLSVTQGYSRDDLKQIAQTNKTVDGLIKQGSVNIKRLDSSKLTDVLIKEVEKHPFLVDVAMSRAEGKENEPKYALGILGGLTNEQLSNLARTQPGRNFLVSAYNSIKNAPQYRNFQMSQVVAQQMNRIDKAIAVDDKQRQEFQGISVDQLTEAMKFYKLSRERAEDLLPYLNQAMYEYKIDTPLKQAVFLAQISVETSGLTDGDFAENYGERQSYAPFYGRGAIQLTLEDAYQNATEYFGKNFLDTPELVADKENAFQTAGWFWTKYKSRDVNNMLSGDSTKTLSEFNAISLMINGGTNGYNERIGNLKNSLQALNVEGRGIVIRDIDKYFGANKK